MRKALIAVFLAVLATGGILAQQTTQVYKTDDGVVAPVLVNHVNPKYTEGAMRRRVQGSVGLTLVVLPDGTVRDDVKVTRPLDDELDQQAVKAVKQWTFKPGTKDDKPVAVQVKAEVSFKLK